MSTSGDYERYFDEDGVRYHHIITPSTGTPAREVHSATVIGPDAVMTDALSTSVFVMGVDLGLNSSRACPTTKASSSTAEGRIFYSDGLEPPAATIAMKRPGSPAVSPKATHFSLLFHTDTHIIESRPCTRPLQAPGADPGGPGGAKTLATLPS